MWPTEWRLFHDVSGHLSCRMNHMSIAEPIWRELYRTDDVSDALTVVTTIAAMEFDVRWRSTEPEADREGNETRPDLGHQRYPRCLRGCLTDIEIGLPPYIIEAPADDLRDLRDVIDDIQAEQWEFETDYVEHRVWRDRTVVLGTVGLVMIPVVFELVVLLRGGR